MGEAGEEERRRERLERSGEIVSCILIQFLKPFVIMMTISNYLITCGFSPNRFLIWWVISAKCMAPTSSSEPTFNTCFLYRIIIFLMYFHTGSFIRENE